MIETDVRSPGQCFRLQFEKISDDRGDLSFLESNRHVPFDIQRVYYLYHLTDGAVRAGHAHRALQQVLIAVNGQFTVTLDNGETVQEHRLTQPDEGLYIPAMVWRVIGDFTPGAVCLVLASDYYDESDYFRHYEDFRQATCPVSPSGTS